MRLFKLLFVLLALSASQSVCAQATTPENSSSQETASSNESVNPDSEAPEDDKILIKRKLEIGLILTAGIFIVGLFLVAVTLIYGRRTRRQIAAGRGPSRVRDELWYLKHANKQTEPFEHDNHDESQEDTK